MEIIMNSKKQRNMSNDVIEVTVTIQNKLQLSQKKHVKIPKHVFVHLVSH